jgi:hypothetical protein
MSKRELKGEPLWLHQLWWRGGQDPNKMTARKIWDLPLLYSLLDVTCSVHRKHILVEMKQGQCICPLSWSVHCNFTGKGKCNERGWACTPHPHRPGLILPSSLNVRQKAAVATLCTRWFCAPQRWLCTLYSTPVLEEGEKTYEEES